MGLVGRLTLRAWYCAGSRTTSSVKRGGGGRTDLFFRYPRRGLEVAVSEYSPSWVGSWEV